MVKFQKSLSDFGTIVGVDLAAQKTGICVFSLKSRKFTEFIPVTVKSTERERELALFTRLCHVFSGVVKEYGQTLVIEERMPNQAGLHSTVQTLQALAGAHWIMRLAVAMTEGAERYDENGIHSTTIKALFKTPDCLKPQKSDIRKALVALYHLDDTQLTDDISDAIAVVHTLLNRKWNADIDDRIKEIKKEIKGLKAQHAIMAHQAEIQRLSLLKI